MNCAPVMNFQEKRKAVPSFIGIVLSWVIVFSCISFVATQTYNCLQKFFRYPQGTKLSIDFNGNNAFPEITVCPHPDFSKDTAWNKTFLDDCGIKR